jgi:hypothetical protein
MFRVGLLALAFTTAAVAQQNLPGTVMTNAPQQMVPSIRPLVTTPTMTLSNGFDPATVTVPQTLVSEQPETMVVGAPEGEGEATATNNGSNNNEAGPADFNFGVVASGSAFNVAATGPALAEIARQSKNYHVQPHKTYTNEDIDRLNSQNSNNGVISATHSNGQPIVAKNNGFEPASGIANMPDVENNEDQSQMANGASEANPMSEGQSSATASNADQGQSNTQQATTPSAQQSTPAEQQDQRQMPASDNPHR